MSERVMKWSAAPKRMVVRGPNWLGDAIMSTPALQRLREFLPEAHITLLTHEKLRDLYLHHPAVNDTLCFGDNDGVGKIARRVRQTRFEAGLIFPNSPRAALELWFAGVPRRIGYARPWRNFFLTHRVAHGEEVPMRKKTEREIRALVAARVLPREVSYPGNAHHVHQYLRLTAAVGCNAAPAPPRLWIAQGETDSVRQRFGLETSEARRWLALNPGAEYGPAKRWPAERFVSVAAQVQKETDCGWIILGGRRDEELTREIDRGIRAQAADPDCCAVMNLSGRTTLRELCVVLSWCRLLLSNDTGPMHVAAAVGTPVVAIFGSTASQLTGPFSQGRVRHSVFQAQVACSPCFRRECPIDFRCMKSIEPDGVARAVLETLQWRNTL